VARRRVTGRRPAGQQPYLTFDQPRPAGPPVDTLVPDPLVAREMNINPITIWRWDSNPELAALGWPPPIRIRKRKYRSRKALEDFKAALVRRAISARRGRGRLTK
jgi:hypothetical protein